MSSLVVAVKQSVEKIRADRRQAAIVLGIGLVVLIIIFLLASNMRKQSELAKAFENLSKAESFHANTTLDLSLPLRMRNRERPIVSVSTQVDSDVTYQDGVPVAVGKLHVDARGRGMVLFTDGDIRILPDAVAFNLQELPALLNPKGNLTGRWTYVDVPLLRTNNAADVRTALRHTFEGLTYEGKDTPPTLDEKLLHFTRAVTPEQEDIMIETFRQGVSGNRGLHVIVRLLRSFDVSSFDVWVDGKRNEIRLVQVTFKRPSDTPEDEPRVVLRLNLSDYNKRVSVDAPEKKLTVNPEIFTKLFGRGEIDGL